MAFTDNSTFRLTLPSRVDEVLTCLETQGEAWIVGGAVRDTYLGRPVEDFDIACSLPAEETTDILTEAGYAVIPTGIAHGTVTALVQGHPIEITHFRTESTYSDGRHPDRVAAASSIIEDLARRDFTMNALAYHPVRGLLDTYGGIDALNKGVIRCVGNPQERFEEDALRILRALRFSSQLGFTLDRETADALRKCKDRLRLLSAERVSKELFLLLCGPGVLEVLLTYPEVLSVVIPEIADCVACPQMTPYHCYGVWEHIARTVDAMPVSPLGRLAALLHDIGKPATHTTTDGRSHFYGHAKVGAEIARRVAGDLRLPKSMAGNLELLVRYHDDVIAPEPKPIRKYLGKLSNDVELFNLLCELKYADSITHAPEFRERAQKATELKEALAKMLEAQEPFSLKDLAVSGKDLLELGYKQGPEVGAALRHLFTEVTEARLENTPSALKDAALQYLHCDK